MSDVNATNALTVAPTDSYLTPGQRSPSPTPLQPTLAAERFERELQQLNRQQELTSAARVKTWLYPPAPATPHGMLQQPESATSMPRLLPHVPAPVAGSASLLPLAPTTTTAQPVLPPDLAAVPETLHRPESATSSDDLRRENEMLRRQLAARAHRPSTATTVPGSVQGPLLFPRYRRPGPTTDNASQRTSTTPSDIRRRRYQAPPLIDLHSSVANSRAAPLSVAPSLRSGRTGISNRSVLVGAEVFSVVHQVTDALLQVTNQSRDDAVAGERLLLQQQQLLQRDFIEKETRDGELALAEKKKQMEKEIKEKQLKLEEKQLQLEEKKLLADKDVKEKQLVNEREIKEKQLLADRELKEKQLQMEREKIAAVAAEKERQLVADERRI